MSRQNEPPAYPPQKDESSYWATQAWSAEDIQALRAAQVRQERGAEGRKQPHRERRGQAQSAQPQGEPLPASEAAPRQGKRSRKSAPPPPTVGDVIHQRRARIDQRRTMRSFFLKLIVIAAMGYALCTYVFGFAAMKGEQMYPPHPGRRPDALLPFGG